MGAGLTWGSSPLAWTGPVTESMERVTVSLPPAKVQDKRAEHWGSRDRGAQRLVSD